MARHWIICALPLLIAAAPPMDVETKKDVRCFTALMFLVEGSGDQAESVAIVSQYFLGRIDARMPRLDLEEAIASEGEAMTEAEVKSLIVSCSTTVESRGKDLVKIGENLQKREAEASSPKS